MKTLTAAITPCPNDTFSFHYLITGDLSPRGYRLNFAFEDVEALNRRALHGYYDMTKMSFHTYLRCSGGYDMLKTGAALGHGCGPLVLSRAGTTPDLKAGCRVALPGSLTTASLLFALYSPAPHTIVNMRYDSIMDAVKTGHADCGVVIHEGRFVYREHGLDCLQDLGEWWHSETGLPVPLGCIACRKDLGPDFAEEFGELLKQSILKARANKLETLPLVRKYAQELDQDVLEKHISTYVNDYSLELSEEGYRAIEVMEKMAREAGVIE